MRFVATAKGRIPISPDLRYGDILSGYGDLKVKTSPRHADGCKQQASSKGQGTIDIVVNGVGLFPDERDAVVWIDLGPKEEYPDRLTRPACPGTPLRKAVSKFSTWEHHFSQSHERSRSGSLGGIELSGWDWKADDETFRSGGLLATLDTPERCPVKLVGCTGMTHFKLYIYPLGD